MTPSLPASPSRAQPSAGANAPRTSSADAASGAAASGATSDFDLLLRQAGLTLTETERGIALADGTLRITADFARLKPRIHASRLPRELLVRAAKPSAARKEGRPLTACDATGGLGDDAFLLAAAGFTVDVYERNPVIATLLRDALSRAAADPVLAAAAQRMVLHESDSIPALRAYENDPLGKPAVVLLDPMFPEKRNSASAKKKLHMLQRIEAPCTDEDELIDAAFAAHPRKIIVKRPIKGPWLAQRKPSYTLSGKAIRFDCYAVSGPTPPQ